jgi:flagellar FliJ protein
MAQFKFQLNGVLRHRGNVEHERQRVLAEAQARQVELEFQLRALDEEVRTSNEEMRRSHLTGRLDLSLMAAHRRYLTATQRRAVEIAQRIAVAQKTVEEARLAVVIAARDRKVLEKLRDKQAAVWQADVQRRELAAQDEVAMQMTYRNATSGTRGEAP